MDLRDDNTDRHPDEHFRPFVWLGVVASGALVLFLSASGSPDEVYGPAFIFWFSFFGVAQLTPQWRRFAWYRAGQHAFKTAIGGAALLFALGIPLALLGYFVGSGFIRNLLIGLGCPLVVCALAASLFAAREWWSKRRGAGG